MKLPNQVLRKRDLSGGGCPLNKTQNCLRDVRVKSLSRVSVTRAVVSITMLIES